MTAKDTGHTRITTKHAENTKKVIPFAVFSAFFAFFAVKIQSKPFLLKDSRSANEL